MVLETGRNDILVTVKNSQVFGSSAPQVLLSVWKAGSCGIFVTVQLFFLSSSAVFCR